MDYPFCPHPNRCQRSGNSCPLPECGSGSPLMTPVENAKTDYACEYLGEVRQINGVAEKVKCGCGGKPGMVWHSVHTCNHPALQKASGRPTLCLKKFIGPFDKDHQLEASQFKLCKRCDHYQPNEKTNG